MRLGLNHEPNGYGSSGRVCSADAHPTDRERREHTNHAVCHRLKWSDIFKAAAPGTRGKTSRQNPSAARAAPPRGKLSTGGCQPRSATARKYISTGRSPRREREETTSRRTQPETRAEAEHISTDAARARTRGNTSRRTQPTRARREEPTQTAQGATRGKLSTDAARVTTRTCFKS